MSDSAKSSMVPQPVKDLHAKHQGFWQNHGFSKNMTYVIYAVIVVLIIVIMAVLYFEVYKKDKTSKSGLCGGPPVGILENNNFTRGIVGNGWWYGGDSDQVGLDVNPNSLTYKLQQAPVYPYYRELVNEISAGSSACASELCSQNKGWGADVQNEVRALSSFGELDYIVSEGAADAKFNAFLSSNTGTNRGDYTEDSMFGNSNFNYTPMTKAEMGAEIASENATAKQYANQFYH
jgi:hypothetical protein